MKKSATFLLFFLLVMAACSDDDGMQPENLLNYDGPNQTGPVLEAGDYEAAARFPASETDRFSGQSLTEVTWFLGPAPQRCKVRVYGPGDGSAPGDLLYEGDVTADVETLSWNTHRLNTPVPITGQELWIAIAFTHTQEQQSIGCDAGPNHPNGDWLFRSSTNDWQRYSNFTPERVNWNVRGRVE